MTRACHIHGGTLADDAYCPNCIAVFDARRNADEMTGDERAVELEALLGPLEIPFSSVHQRIEELVGRSVWTHEFALADALVDEARTRAHPSMGDIISKIHEINPNAEVIVVTAGEDGAP